MGRVTLQTIADEVGVSRMTVSNAFSRPDQLSAELRERVLAAAERLGYAGPDAAARALTRGRTGVIGMLLDTSPFDAFVDEAAVGFVRAAAAGLAEAGYSLVLLHANREGEIVPTRDVAMDGAIVYSCAPQSEGVADLRRRRLPIVRVEGLPIDGVASVAIDDEGGARAAAEHLLALGHRDIAIVAAGIEADGAPLHEPPASDWSMTRGRLRGWYAALERADVVPRIVATGRTAADAAARAGIRDLLEAPPTAVLCWSDLAAVEVLAAARETGLRVPEDLSVVGFDDVPMASRVTPQLTTVRQDLDAKGAAAVGALLAMLAGQRPEPLAPLATRLVVRGSAAPPRSEDPRGRPGAGLPGRPTATPGSEPS
ncbi:LacI family DNA-binding transcriptional regulator [Agrococcus sp. SL85]|uniref:LacI family DNA-binding transcriptional regulator n=1 Tax=Agrococcus sp. SL85 TaxID=2995141 RepID=UPI00226C932A|nr:LacI family DNA-binding transcriptional regulator [Agrococcus sp. SL85]WAC65909.1 LacI family DNA-binding transcriptional regulator [Agrococcus sp. SL85]